MYNNIQSIINKVGKAINYELSNELFKIKM